MGGSRHEEGLASHRHRSPDRGSGHPRHAHDRDLDMTRRRVRPGASSLALRSARALTLLRAMAALVALTGCRGVSGTGEVSLTVDLRRGDEGTIAVDLEMQARAGVPVALSSFVQ